MEVVIFTGLQAAGKSTFYRTHFAATHEQVSKDLLRNRRHPALWQVRLIDGPGDVLILFQPRLDVTVGEWRIRGDVDLLWLARDDAGDLHVLIADIKSSTSVKVEHRLQVAFYHEMLATLFAQEGVTYDEIALAVLYCGPADGEGLTPEQAAAKKDQGMAARDYFGLPDGLLEIVADADDYVASVQDLVTGPASTAVRVSEAEFTALPYHLTYKCDGCLYNEFCMKWSAEHDDLSLLPHLTAQEKGALQRTGIHSMRELAVLKDFRPTNANQLIPAPGKEALVKQLATTRPVGPRVDELVHRARRYRRLKGDDLRYVSVIPSKGYGSLPYCDATHNPNLVKVYIDAQHDYLTDRIYMLGALVVAYEGGTARPGRQRSIVHLTDGPPVDAQQEEALFLRWIGDTLRAVGELAAPDDAGQARAPIHMIFYNNFEQQLLLDGLARHFTRVFGATPLYDLVTQLAAFDSPVATFLEREIAELKNYPMVCQSLQAVAAYLTFDWDKGAPYWHELFRTRLFDFWGKLDQPPGQESPWYTSRSRFNSQIPLEYAYAAWGELEGPQPGQADEFSAYRKATPGILRAFHARRLEAMEHIANDFSGNKQTEKSAFDLPDLQGFSDKATTLAQALDEFVTIERHVELADWKRARLAPPERRVLSGITLLGRYLDEDQDPGTAERNRDNESRRLLKEQYREAYLLTHPGARQVRLPKEQKAETDWSQEGMVVRLRFDMTDVDCELHEMLGLTTLRVGARVILAPRTTTDDRVPEGERKDYTPTPKQLLWGTRGDIGGMTIQRDTAGRAVKGSVAVELQGSRGGGAWSRGFVFGSMDRPLLPGTRYTLDEDPNNWYGYWCARVTGELSDGAPNTLYERLTAPEAATALWSPAAARGQARFLAGLEALEKAGALHSFEPGKKDYIGGHGASPTLLVQGPPGTGKSYATAFALFARLQGALIAEQDFRVVVSCKTHAATDVLLDNVCSVQGLLRRLQGSRPALFAQYFDRRLLDVPLFRARGQDAPPEGVHVLLRPEDRAPGTPPNSDEIVAHRWCIVAATPGAMYSMINEKWPKQLFGHELYQCLVLDETSQMNLPEAMMAALGLGRGGQLIVVGDHRQMPPIIKHSWDTEPRRTFAQFRTYESLFLALLPLQPPMIKFEESFRLHADMAEFLRREIYQQDGIRFHSKRHDVLPALPNADPFVASVLLPHHPLVVVVHDEAESQQANPFEQSLLVPLLAALADERLYGLDPEHGLGVVVPHRAQRAALQDAVPYLTVRDPQTGVIMLSAVDTVERFQGGERTAILVSATESEREYLLAASRFSLDPRRLTVALSRAKRKMVLVAAQSVFNLFSAAEETFANVQLWKNLLRYTCTVKLWEGERDGRQVVVWGNQPV